MLGLRQRRPRKFWNEDLARFIGTHRACGGGIDVTKLGPSVQIRCKGCDAGIVRGRPLPEQFTEQLAAGPSPSAGRLDRRPPPPGLRPPASARARRPPRLPELPAWWRSAAVLAVLLAFAAAVVVVVGGDPRSDGSSLAPADPSASVAAAPQTSPAQSAIPPTAPAAVAEPRDGAQVKAAEPASKPAADANSSSLPFKARLPRGWREGQIGEAVAFAPGGSPERAAVTVYFERNSSLRPEKMSPAAAKLLAGRHSGARVSHPEPAKLGGHAAMLVTATYPGGKETALVSAAAGYRYLVIKTLPGDAGRGTRAEAQQLLEGIKLDRR
jgi:hypothetical protein